MGFQGFFLLLARQLVGVQGLERLSIVKLAELVLNGMFATLLPLT